MSDIGVKPGRPLRSLRNLRGHASVGKTKLNYSRKFGPVASLRLPPDPLAIRRYAGLG